MFISVSLTGYWRITGQIIIVEVTCAFIRRKHFALNQYFLWLSSDAPQLSGSEDVTVEEEAELVLGCDIRANPRVSSVSWTLNGSAVDLLAYGLSVTSDGLTTQLIAGSVERSLHEGRYQCTVISPKYGERSKTFTVTVTGQFCTLSPKSHLSLT